MSWPRAYLRRRRRSRSCGDSCEHSSFCPLELLTTEPHQGGNRGRESVANLFRGAHSGSRHKQSHFLPMPRSTLDGQSVIVMPMGLSLGPGGSAIHMGPLLQHAAHGGGSGSMGRGGPGSGAAAIMSSGGGHVADPRELEPQPLCEWRNMWCAREGPAQLYVW